MESRVESLLHVAIGVAGEWLELSSARTQDHRVEECGDVEFYLQAGYNLVGEPPRRFSGLAMFDGSIWYEEAGNPLDLIKKAWVYGKELDETVFARSLLRVEENLSRYYSTFLGVTREFVLDANVAKLRKRYPDGYTDAAAQARADKVEG